MVMTVAEQGVENQEKTYIRGKLLYTIFQNEQEFFSIAKISIEKTNEDLDDSEIVIKGHFTNLHEGTLYNFYGHFDHHPKFGKQYHIDHYEMYVPNDRDGLISYLSSDLFPGVGKKSAGRIVDHLGTNAIRKILEQPQVLEEIPRLTKRVREQLVKNLKDHQGFERVVVYLFKYGLSLQMCQKIYDAYQHEAIEILQQDPYQYVFDIEGFSFQMADQIARRNGISLTHENRIKAGIIYVLQQSIRDGHVYLPMDICIRKVKTLLATNELVSEDIQKNLKELNKKKEIIVTAEKVYLPVLYYAEDGFSSHIKRILEKPIDVTIDQAELMTIIGEIEEKEVLSYGQEQFDAIQQALQSKIMIVTGGPGTGKTTVIKGILHAYAKIHDIPYDLTAYEDKSEYPFILAAPTGRAAKRLSESTGLPAYTIHRLLGWNGQDQFAKDEHDQLSGKFLIIDEFSMVDIWLANHLFKAIPNDMQVLIVGDEDQLPSVGPGQVLADIISSDQLPFVTLHEVYRQKEGSKIISLAHEIKHDQCTLASLTKAEDFNFIPCHENQMMELITTIVQKALDKGIDPQDIQILAPMYRTRVGIHEINQQLQAIINPKSRAKREIRRNDVVFRVGDKVIQLVNQPEDGVSNGDIGEIVAIFRENENTNGTEQIVISFDGKEVVYEKTDYDSFMHAYCISIHKSQGSEFPIVILPVVGAYRRMLRKNLLYTAVTRAKQSLVLCGDRHAFLKGIQTQDTNKRYSSLPELMSEKLDNSLRDEKHDVMEEEISPYDFM